MAILTRRWAVRASLIGCLLLFAGAQILGAVTPSFGILLISRTLAAVANAGFLAVALNTTTTLVPPQRRGRALAVLLSGTTLATIAGVPGGAMLGALFTWRATFWAVALLCLPAVVGVLRGAPETPIREAGSSSALRDELAIFAAPAPILAMLLAATINAATFSCYTFLAPLITGPAGLDPLWVPICLVIFGSGSFVGVSIAGRLADRHSTGVIGVGIGLLLLGWIALASAADHPTLVLILLLVQGILAFAVGSTAISAVLGETTGASTLSGASATVALNVGAAGGPVIAAIALRYAPDPVTPIWVGVVLVAAAVPLAVCSRRARRHAAA